MRRLQNVADTYARENIYKDQFSSSVVEEINQIFEWSEAIEN